MDEFHPTALTIAGSDPSGGAGIQADLKMFQYHGVYGMSVITLLTVQNTKAVERVNVIEPELITEQLECIFDDLPVHAAKTGALGSKEVICLVARAASRHKVPLIVDPVLVSTHGAALLQADARSALLDELAPQSTLFTPNIPEAALLLGREIRTLDHMVAAAESLQKLGIPNVLLKGGHLDESADDVLLIGKELEILRARRVDTQHTHGTGCALSAAITARISRGEPLLEAVRGAKLLINRAITTAPGLGHGHGPINFFTSPENGERLTG